MDSQGRAWVPVVAALKVNGYRVCRANADNVKVLRRATNRKNKTDRIDAATLAPALIVDPEGTEEIFLATSKGAKLYQFVHQREKIVDSIHKRKLRIQANFETTNPYFTQALGRPKFTKRAQLS